MLLIKMPRMPRRRGLSLVEGAVAIPVCLVLMLGIFEFSRLIMVQNVCDNAARFGARYAAVHTDDRTTNEVLSQIESRMPKAARAFQNYTRNGNIEIYESDTLGAKIGTGADTWKNAAFNELIAVKISGTYKPITPAGWVGFNQINFRSLSIMYSEAN